jgi:hypothetical protein
VRFCCPHCNEQVIRPRADDTLTVRARLFVVKRGAMYAVCRECGGEVDVSAKFRQILGMSSHGLDKTRVSQVA